MREYTLKVKPSPEQKNRQHKVYGVNVNLGICSFIHSLLEVNELLPTSKKMTDEVLWSHILREFPKAKSTTRFSKDRRNGIGYWRSQYKGGYLGLVRISSRRYSDQGLPIDVSSGKPLEGIELVEELNKIEEDVKLFWERTPKDFEFQYNEKGNKSEH